MEEIRKNDRVKELKEEDLAQVIGGVTLGEIINQPGFSIIRGAGFSQPLGLVTPKNNQRSHIYLFDNSDGE